MLISDIIPYKMPFVNVPFEAVLLLLLPFGAMSEPLFLITILLFAYVLNFNSSFCH